MQKNSKKNPAAPAQPARAHNPRASSLAVTEAIQAVQGSQKNKKGRVEGTQNFSDADLEFLLKTIESVKPLGQLQWMTVQDLYNAHAGRQNRSTRTFSALRDKWNRLIRAKPHTGDPHCPPVSFRAHLFIFMHRAVTDSIGF